MPPPLARNQPMPAERFAAVEVPRMACGAVVLMVKVVVALEPLTGMDAGMVQVIRAVLAEGGVQLRSTVPVKLFSGSMVMVEVPGPPGVVMVTEVPPTVYVGVVENPGQLVTKFRASMEPSPLAGS